MSWTAASRSFPHRLHLNVVHSCSSAARSGALLSSTRLHVGCRLPRTAQRSFSQIDMPIGPRDPDNVYRRPFVGPVNRPLTDRDILWFHDGQAPEPAFDSADINPWKALAMVSCVLGFMWVVVPAIIRVVAPPGSSGPVPQDYSHLKRQLGGPDSEVVSKKKKKASATDHQVKGERSSEGVISNTS